MLCTAGFARMVKTFRLKNERNAETESTDDYPILLLKGIEVLFRSALWRSNRPGSCKIVAMTSYSIGDDV